MCMYTCCVRVVCGQRDPCDLHQYMYVRYCDENSRALIIVPVSSIQEYSRSEDGIAAVALPQAETSGCQDSTLSACVYVCLVCLCTVYSCVCAHACGCTCF